MRALIILLFLLFALGGCAADSVDSGATLDAFGNEVFFAEYPLCRSVTLGRNGVEACRVR